MSDLYLDLRHRIHVVTEWTEIPTEELQRAQDRIGLSDEKVARRIPVSVKTWSRYKKRGAVPTHLLPRIAPILGFELIPVEPIQIPITDGDPSAPGAIMAPPDLRESLATLIDLVQRLAETAEHCEAALGRIEQSSLAPGGSRTRARPQSPAR